MYRGKPIIDKRVTCEWCGVKGKEENFKRIQVGWASGVYVNKALKLCLSCWESYRRS